MTATAAAVGAAMVAARLTGTEALQQTVGLIGAEFGTGPRVGAVQGALTAGYAQELAELTHRQQESVVWSVLHEACRQARNWDGEFVSVNLAELQARDPGPLDEVTAVLVETGASR